MKSLSAKPYRVVEVLVVAMVVVVCNVFSLKVTRELQSVFCLHNTCRTKDRLIVAAIVLPLLFSKAVFTG